MVVTLIEVKETECGLALKKLQQDHPEIPSNLMALTLSKFIEEFDGDIHLFLRKTMSKLKSSPTKHKLVLINTHLWFREAIAEPTEVAFLENSDDSDDEADHQAVMGRMGNDSSNGLLYSFLNWYVTRKHDIYVIFEHGIPKMLRSIPGVVINSNLLTGYQHHDTSSEALCVNVNGEKYTCTATSPLSVIGVMGSSGSGKTRILKEIANEIGVDCVSWIYCHEIVDCELGQSTRIVRGLFRTASSRSKPSVVILDNADLILNTSGRIMKEITEEIGVCISEFSSGFFIYSAVSEKFVPNFIRGKTTTFIHLD